jgi:hypothetical protein
MGSIYSALASLARQFFRRTGIPVPPFVRQAHRRIRSSRSDAAAPRPREEAGGLREEVAALAHAVERLETMAYLDHVGRRPEA